MNKGHVYNYTDGISYPREQMPSSYTYHNSAPAPPSSSIFNSDPQIPLNPIYPPNIKHLSDKTKANLHQLRDKLINGDPCFEYGLQHWHPNCNKKSTFQAWEQYPAHASPEWENHDVLFSSSPAISKNKSLETTVIPPPCYLCSTLDEHKQHMARSAPGLKAKHKVKPRIEFIPPPPIVKKKKTEVEEKQEVLYKITVKTGNHHNAGTNAKASIQLHGRNGHMKKRSLCKKLAVAFTFGRGTSETFYMKGPHLGDLKYITIEHDGIEQKHCWFLEWVEVMTVTTGDIWFFPCGQWLSLYHGDYRIKRNLRSEKKEISDIDFKVTTVTADKSYAGTDANVFITLHGKRGVSPKFPLKNKSKDCFEKGMKDDFTVTTKDIGSLSYIRIEHDNSGVAAGWLLEQVKLTSSETGRTLIFPCGQWLATNEGDKQLYKILYPAQGHNKSAAIRRSTDTFERQGSSEEVLYEVTICTGRQNYAGTDANVYIIMHGKLGQTRELQFVDDDGKKYEKGSRDVFKIRAEDVGQLKKMQVRHDNKGMAAGWFLEEIIVKKFFSKSEIKERLKLLDPNHKEVDDSENFGKDPSEAKFKGSVTFEEKERQKEREKLFRDEKERDRKKKEKQRKKALDRARGKQVSDTESESDEGISRSKYGRRRREKGYDEDLDEYTETRNSRNSQRKHGKQHVKNKNKKKVVYRGIVQYVTDSEYDTEDDDDSDDDNYKKKHHSTRKQRRNYKESDSESEGDIKDHSKRNRQTRKINTDSDTDTSTKSSDSESDDPYRPASLRKGRPHMRQSKNHKRASTLEKHKLSQTPRTNINVNPNEMSTKWKSNRIPLCDEFTFPLNRWLAEDEDDGQIMRTIKVNKITTFYRLPSES